MHQERQLFKQSFNQDYQVSLRYYLKQCTGIVDSITLNILNASADEPISTAVFEETVTTLFGVTSTSIKTETTEYDLDSGGANVRPTGSTVVVDTLVFGSQLENFCCPDVTFEYAYSNTPSGGPTILPSSYTSVGTNEIRMTGIGFAHIGDFSTPIGTLSYTAGATVRFNIRITDCNENTDIVGVIINDAVLA